MLLIKKVELCEGLVEMRIFHLVGTYIQLKRSQYPSHSEEFVITPFVTLFDVLFVYMMALKFESNGRVRSIPLLHLCQL